MASAISHRMRSNLQSVNANLNAISNTALLRCLTKFPRAHPLLFWLFSPMIVPTASCLVFLSSVVLSGIALLAIFYGILFLMFLPTLMVVLSGPTMLALCIVCTCYISYQGYLFVQRCLRIAKRAPEIARQFYITTLERAVWFLGMENGNPFTNQHWITLWTELLRRSQIVCENFVTFPQVVKVQRILEENYQMVTERIEQSREVFYQAAEYCNDVLAFPRQVGNTIQRIVSIVLMTVHFVVFFPRRMMDMVVMALRQVLYILTQGLETCQSIAAKIITIISTVTIAVQSIPGYPKRMMDGFGCIYRQVVSIMVHIQHLFQPMFAKITTLVSTVTTSIQSVVCCSRQVTDKILFTYRQVESIVIQVHLLLQSIATYFTRMTSSIISAIHLVVDFPRHMVNRLVLAYRQVHQLYQSIRADITAIITTIISTIQFVLNIPRQVIDKVVQTYRQVVSIVMYIHQLYRIMADKIVATYRLIISTITTAHQLVSFLVSIPNQIWTFFSEKPLKERLEEQLREIERKIEQTTNEMESRMTRIIHETRNTNVINVNITNPALLPDPQIRDAGVTVTDIPRPRERWSSLRSR